MEKGWKIDLQMELANLPRQEKKAARYLLEQEEQIETMTIRQCAAGAGIGQPTVVRLVHRLGYESWKQFRDEVLKQWGEGTLIRKEEKMGGAIPTDSIRQDVELLREMAEGIDRETFREVIRLLGRAGSVDIYGVERSAFVAGELACRLLHMGIPGRIYTDLFLQKVSAEYLNEQSVVIVISQSAVTRVIVEAVQTARSAGARIIGILGRKDGPVARCCDHVFVTPSVSFEGGEKAASRIAQIGLVDLLCEGLIRSDEKRFRENIRKSREKFI